MVVKTKFVFGGARVTRGFFTATTITSTIAHTRTGKASLFFLIQLSRNPTLQMLFKLDFWWPGRLTLNPD